MRIRAVQFVVQPVLVADDGEELSPVRCEPITVPAADWPTFSSERWSQLVAEQEAQLSQDEA